jgi:uncharacterized protein YecE (DUF72 family)
LQHWGDRIDAWQQGGQPKDAQLIVKKTPRARKSRDVYCYFDNDIKVRAPYDARRLLERFNLTENLEVAPGDLHGATL